jgi:hypothetical protein
MPEEMYILPDFRDELLGSGLNLFAAKESISRRTG